MGKVQTVQPCL